MAGAMPAASLILCFLSNRPLRAVIRLNSGWAIVALVCCLSKARFRLTLYSPCRVFLRINCWRRRPAPVSCSPLSIRPCQYTPNIRFPTANLRLAPCLSGVRPAYFPPQARFLAFLYIRLMYHAMRLILRPAPARRTARMLAAAGAFLWGRSRVAPVCCSPQALFLGLSLYAPNIRCPAANLRRARPGVRPVWRRFIGHSLYTPNIRSHAAKFAVSPSPDRRTTSIPPPQTRFFGLSGAAPVFCSPQARFWGDPALRRSAACRRRFFGPFSKYAQYTLSCG